MTNVYHFTFNEKEFILKIQFSKIGYGYANLFIHPSENSYINLDISIPTVFGMTAEDWNSWLDGTQTEVTDETEFSRLCAENRVNWETLKENFTQEG